MRAVIRDEDQHLVVGEVYVPNRLDSDNEFMQKDEIEAAARRFMLQNANSNVDREHNFKQSPEGDTIVQSYIAKANDPDGYIEGSWIAEGYVRDPDRWEAIKRGEINGWSMAGHADKVPRTVTITALTSMKTETLPHSDHSHNFTIKFDEDGRVLPTQTETFDGHYHGIRKTTATEESNGHSHRFEVNWDDNTENITKEEKTIEAKELVNVHPTWLSLVRHAAVRRGFKIVKSDQPRDDHGRFSNGFHTPREPFGYEKSIHYGGATVADIVPNIHRLVPVTSNIDKEEVQKMDRVVHAIVTERDYDLSEVLNREDLLWPNDAEIFTRRMVTVAKGEKHILVEQDAFEEGSLKVMKLGDVDIVAGILKSDATGNALKAPTKLVKEEEMSMSMTRDEVQEMIKAEIQSTMASELGALKSDLMGAIAKLDVVKGNTETDMSNQTSGEIPEEDIEKCKSKKAEYTQRPDEEQTEGQSASDGEPKLFKAEMEVLKAQLDSLTKMFTEKTEALIKKTDTLMSKTTSYPGALDDSIEIVKSEKEDGFWAGRLFARSNPKIDKILRGR